MNLTKLAMRLNFWVRSHPSKFLYGGAILGNFLDPAEAPYLRRNWNGAVWDVGASVGKYTTILAHHNTLHNVYAFEPNLNSLYYLAYRTQHLRNVRIVPNALTAHAQEITGSFNPDFNAPPTGPKMLALTLTQALVMCGLPRFVKLDIEGAEYDLINSSAFQQLRNATMLISWHRGIQHIPGWSNTVLAADISLLEPLK